MIAFQFRLGLDYRDGRYHPVTDDVLRGQHPRNSSGASKMKEREDLKKSFLKKNHKKKNEAEKAKLDVLSKAFLLPSAMTRKLFGWKKNGNKVTSEKYPDSDGESVAMTSSQVSVGEYHSLSGDISHQSSQERIENRLPRSSKQRNQVFCTTDMTGMVVSHHYSERSHHAFKKYSIPEVMPSIRKRRKLESLRDFGNQKDSVGAVVESRTVSSKLELYDVGDLPSLSISKSNKPAQEPFDSCLRPRKGDQGKDASEGGDIETEELQTSPMVNKRREVMGSEPVAIAAITKRIAAPAEVSSGAEIMRNTEDKEYPFDEVEVPTDDRCVEIICSNEEKEYPFDEVGVSEGDRSVNFICSKEKEGYPFDETVEVFSDLQEKKCTQDSQEDEECPFDCCGVVAAMPTAPHHK